MIRFVLIIFAILMASEAEAETFGCEFVDKKGNYLFYGFDVLSKSLVGQYRFEKNKQAESYPAGSRPPWTMAWDYDADGDARIKLRYVRDPSFEIWTSGNRQSTISKAGTPMKRYFALIFKGNQVITSKGQCNFADNPGDGV